MNVIVAVDENWAIGNKGELLISIPADHKLFREETYGKVVVLGRKTLKTFPQGQPLEGRTNIVLSRDENLKIKGAIVVNSTDALLSELSKYPKEDIFIIGGESVYKELLPYCDVVHVTKIEHKYEADAYFPNLDEMDDWEMTQESDEQCYFDLTYYFQKYERVKK
ncbi:MAG: dihydrofolate reductase [Lachnospiraceae bacterium]|nr:dihydrofolate reductase [Lachnospiraceae bacterium]